jgi:hypothetical protein
MKHLAAGAGLLFVLASAGPVAAQQTPDRGVTDAATRIEQTIERSGVVPALEALATSVTPELERTVDELAATLNVLADRTARDPELRASATRAARGMVDVAEVVVVEQTSVLQQILREAADRLETIAAARERRQ